MARADDEACLQAHEEAQLLRLRGSFSTARTKLLECAQPSCPAPVMQECVGWLTEVEASQSSVVFAVSGAGGLDLVKVHVSANGDTLTTHLDGRATDLDPGVYTLRFEAEGHAPAELQVTVREAEKQRLISVDLSPLEASKSSADRTPSAAYVLGGTAVLSLGGGIATGLLGKRELTRLEDECGADGCSDAERTRGKRLYIAADVAFGVSAALAIAATWVCVSNLRASRRSVAWQGPRLDAGVLSGGGYVSLRRTF